MDRGASWVIVHGVTKSQALLLLLLLLSRSVVSNSARPHGLQPIRFLRPWDFPGKSTGVGCHFVALSYTISY